MADMKVTRHSGGVHLWQLELEAKAVAEGMNFEDAIQAVYYGAKCMGIENWFQHPSSRIGVKSLCDIKGGAVAKIAAVHKAAAESTVLPVDGPGLQPEVPAGE